MTELEVTVKVPKDTKAKDIQYKVTPRSVDLKVALSDGTVKTLLDGTRTLRGRVSLDGTYWVISDVTQDPGMVLSSPYREVTVSIEKSIKTPADDFEVVEYDWKGVYLEEFPDEVSVRTYDGPEELDVREYAAGLGVDIDHINASLVDKSMFSSGLNLTQSSMEELQKAGLLKEVTQQADGSEFTVDSESGEAEPLMTGSNGDNNNAQKQQAKSIPFLDTNSPWHNAIPVNETNQVQQQLDTADDVGDLGSDDGDDGDDDSEEEVEEQEVMQQKRYFTRAAFATDAAAKQQKPSDKQAASDPIDLLTVKKLKEILKSQGLKVSGNKKELQDRLRQQVNSLLQGGGTTQNSSSPSQQE